MSKTILLADDSLTIQKVVELTFADTDYDVVAVSGGEELLAKIPDTDPDLVICDVIMPGKDGYDVCQEIKSDPDTLHIPVILLTGTFEPFDRDRALAVGCSDIITKPFEARKLVETVERLVEGGEDAAEAPEPEPSAVTPPREPEPAETDPAKFGTRLAPPAGAEAEQAAEPADDAAPGLEEEQEAPTETPTGEELDFTTTGFAEMEAAGEAQRSFVPPAPDDGLEFDQFADADVGDEPENGQPEPEQEPEPPGEVAESDAEESDDEAEELATVPERELPGEPFAPPSEPPPPPEAPTADSAATDPTMTVPLSSYQPPAPDDDIAEPAEPLEEPWQESPPDSDAAEVAAVEPDVAEIPEDVPEELGQEDAAVADAAEAAAEEHEEPPAATDTAPLVSVAEVPATRAAEAEESEDAADTPPEPAPAALSDEDVERIARRVLELAADRLEGIAWEVIPDMAEIVVRERIRELEDEVERTSDGQE